MHSRLLPTPKAPKSFWKVGLASALCQKAAFSVTQQTEGEAYCVSADTQVVAGKGRTNVQVNNQTKSTQYDTPYDDNISFFANTERSRKSFGDEKVQRVVDGWKLEDKSKKMISESKFKHERSSGPTESRVVSSFYSSSVCNGQADQPLDVEKIKAYNETLSDLKQQHKSIFTESFDQELKDLEDLDLDMNTHSSFRPFEAQMDDLAFPYSSFVKTFESMRNEFASFRNDLFGFNNHPAAPLADAPQGSKSDNADEQTPSSAVPAEH